MLPITVFRSAFTLALAASGLVVAAASPVQADVIDDGGFVALTPARLLDTRDGTGAPKAAVKPGGTVTFQVAGRGGVASDAAAAVLNVIVTQQSRSGSVRVYPAGVSMPNISSISFVQSQTIANQVTTRLGTSGRVSISNNSAGTIHLLAHVAGWYRGGTATEPGTFTPLNSPVQLAKLTVPRSGRTPVDVGGHGGIPSEAGAAALNFTADPATQPGYITAYPAGTTMPKAANLTLRLGQRIANAATVGLGTGGDVTLFNGSSAAMPVQVDASGYFKAGTPAVAGAFNAVTPGRILDTRDLVPKQRVQPGKTVTLSVAGGSSGVPTGASAVVLNLTAVLPGGPGYVVAYPTGSRTSGAPGVNFIKGQTSSTLVTVTLSPDGKVTFFNGATGPVDITADLFGYYVGDGPPDRSNWKLTLPLDDDNNGIADEVKRSDLQTYERSPWFYTNDTGDGLVFRANAGGATTSGSDYPRSELREMKPNGGDFSAGNAAWSNSSGTHVMTMTQAITNLPEVKPHVVAGQIHNGAKDVAVIRLEKNKSTGKNRLFVKTDNGSLDLDTDYQLGTRFAVQVAVVNGTITVRYWKASIDSGPPDATVTPTPSTADVANPWFFKAGVYTQSNTSTTVNGQTEQDGAYGEVVIYDLKVAHDPAL